MRIDGFSTALYSTWLYLPDYRLLFDAGDGAAAHLARRAKQVDVVAITHQHCDHIAGLLELISWARLDPPCTVLYPAGSDSIVPASRDGETIRATGADQKVSCVADVNWIALPDRRDHALAHPPDSFLRPFATDHKVGGRDGLTTGYSLIARRNQSPADAKTPSRSAGDPVTETILLTVTGDTSNLPPDRLPDGGVLVHECTYLDRADVSAGTGGLSQHCLLEELLDRLAGRRFEHLVLYHLNERYTAASHLPLVRQACRRAELNFPVSVIWPGSLQQDILATPVWSPSHGDSHRRRLST